MATNYSLVLRAIGALLIATLAALAGCGGGGSDPTTPPPGGGTAKALAVKSVMVGAVRVDFEGATPGGPVAVGAPVVINYDANGAKVSAAVTTTCGSQQLNGVETSATPGVATFSHDQWPSGTACSGTYVFPSDYGSVSGTFGFQTEAAAVVAPTVTLAATPTTVVAGDPTTLRWTTMGAANCLASDGWNGSVASAGDNLVVNPTATTTYSIECWGPTGLTTGVVSTTVTVTPKPVVTYPAVVILFGPNWVHRVDPTAPDGIDPIANNTGHPRIGGFGFRTTVLPNCQIQVSAVGTGNAEISVLYDRINKALTLDTSGTAPPRLVENYTFASPWNPDFPTAAMGLVVGDEKFWVPDTTATLSYQKGTAPSVNMGPYPLWIKGLVAYPACTVQ